MGGLEADKSDGEHKIISDNQKSEGAGKLSKLWLMGSQGMAYGDRLISDSWWLW